MGSQHRYDAQWMARWMQASSSATTQLRINYLISKETNAKNIIGKGCLPADSMRTDHTTAMNGALDVPDLEAVGTEMGKWAARNNSIRIMDAKAVKSDVELQGCSVGWKNMSIVNYHNSDNFQSDWNHFPMLPINQKMESIFALKRRHGSNTLAVGTVESELPSSSKLASHEVEFAKQEHFQTWTLKQNYDQSMRSFKSIEGMTTHGDDYTRLNTISTVDRLELQRPSVRPSMCSKSEHDSYRLGMMRCSQRSSYSTCIVTKTKDCRQIFGESRHSLLPIFVNGCTQLLRNSCEQEFPLQFKDKGKSKEIEDPSCSEQLQFLESIAKQRDIDDFDDGRYLLHKMPKCPFHDLEHREANASIDSIERTSQKFCSTPHFLLKEMDMNLSHGDKLAIESNCLPDASSSKMLVMPWKHSSRLQRNFVHSEKTDGRTTNVSLKGKQESSAKTDTMYVDVSQCSRSVAGVNDSMSTEGVEMHAKLASPKMYGSQPDMHPVGGDTEKQKECIKYKEITSSTTESMDADDFVSHVERPSGPLEPPSDPGPSKKWINRLKRSPLVYPTVGAKRLKIGEASVNEGTTAMLSNSLNEQEQCDGNILLRKNRGSSSGDIAKTMNTWIRRWSCNKNNQEKVSEPEWAAQVLCEPEKSKIVIENLEAKQFPSIAAMALMGRALSNFKPCEFHKRGSSVVWNNNNTTTQ